MHDDSSQIDFAGVFVANGLGIIPFTELPRTPPLTPKPELSLYRPLKGGIKSIEEGLGSRLPRRRIRFGILFALAIFLSLFAITSIERLRTPSAARIKTNITSNVAIVILATSEKPFLFRALSSLQRYANKHGYALHMHLGLHALDIPHGTPAVWSKLPAIIKAFEETGAKWVWMIDSDALLTNSSKKLEDLLPADDSDIHTVVATDCNRFNFGSSLWRNSAYSRLILSEMFERGRNGSWKENEQGMFQKFHDENVHGLANKTLIGNQWEMNGYPEEIPCYQKEGGRAWQRGDLVIHFPGAWTYPMNNITDRMKNYEYLTDKYAPQAF